MDFSNFKFRCSSLGYIMADTKEKSNAEKYTEALESRVKKLDALSKCTEKAVKTREKLENELYDLDLKIEELEAIKDIPTLSDTCKTHLCDVYTSQKYNRREDIKSKYLEKGLLMEEDAITQYSLLTGAFHKKNGERRENDYITGEMDFEDETYAIDTKVNWSIFQFTRTVAKPIKPLYHWQLDGYMWLWGKQKGKLVYALLDTPEHLVVMEEKKLLYDFVGTEEDYKEACAELRRNHTYSDIPLEEKIRTFEVEYDEERIGKLQQRVIACRQFLQDLDNRVKQ